MKKLRLISLVGITSIALAQVTWAGHGGGAGGGGGGHFGGGGGGHFGGGGGAQFGGGGGFRAGGLGGAHFAGGGFSVPRASLGVASRGGGVGFGNPRFSGGIPHVASQPAHVQSFGPSRQSVQHNPAGNPTRSVTNVNRGNRQGNNPGRTTAGVNRPDNRGGAANGHQGQVSRSTTPRPSNEASLSKEHHIFARENGGQHRDWDRRHAHFFRGHWFCWDGAFWIGLDYGYYPWDFYPYYGYDYYPYDYYTDVEPSYQSYANQQPDPTVSTVQTDLAQLGYYSGPIDGLFGADTRTALTRYQVDRGLQVTGSLTNETLQSLGLPGLASN
jgi:Putative peptidoglycan binding domain